MNTQEREKRKEEIRRRMNELEREGGWRFSLTDEEGLVDEGGPLEFYDAIIDAIGPHRMTISVFWTREA